MTGGKHRISSLRTVGTFLAGRACSDTLFHVLGEAFGDPLLVEERAAMPLAGGIMQHGYQCGMIWGAALAAGARAYRLLGGGPRAEARAIVAARRLLESFRALNRHTDCVDLTGMDASASAVRTTMHFFVKGGAITCFRMAASYAPVALRAVETALSEDGAEAPPPPVSCAAMLARRMGASELHAVMAAGLAGGIGLSGGACGALGAALWIAGMRSIEGGAAKLAYKAPAALDLVERFLRCTGYEFECSEIVKRRFDGVGDHAGYVRGGGCARVLDVLAAG